ncbi:NAD-dependent epimerase/dehydratase family protein [archaeon]|jgi:UDP-glucose 4-epimerase|nr:NAD-dependent epimerase/dehydratase family protein [archaeon]
MRAIVTGGAGFIGSHLVDALINENHEVIIIDNLLTGKTENINLKATFYNQDLQNHEKIKEIFEKHKPEIVYHLAAQIDLRKSIKEPIEDAKINILSTINLLELSAKNNIKHFIFSSTGGAIYGDTKQIPTIETHKEQPSSPYGCSKLTIEKYLHSYSKVHNLKYTCLRYSNVYGPRQNAKGEAGVIAIFLNKLFNNQTPTIFGGIQTRDFVYVHDVVRANLLALNDPTSNTYNISTSKQTDVIEIFSKINKYFNNKFAPHYEGLKKGEQKISCLSYEKIKKNLGWEPLTNIDEGLDKTYCWFLMQRQSTNPNSL